MSRTDSITRLIHTLLKVLTIDYTYTGIKDSRLYKYVLSSTSKHFSTPSWEEEAQFTACGVGAYKLRLDEDHVACTNLLRLLTVDLTTINKSLGCAGNLFNLPPVELVREELSQKAKMLLIRGAVSSTHMGTPWTESSSSKLTIL